MRTKTAVGFFVLVVALGVTGCESNNKGKIEGTKWSSNPGTFSGVKLASGQILLEFSKDGEVKWSGTDIDGVQLVFTGRYTLGMGDIVVIDLDEELGGSLTHAESITISKGELTMTRLRWHQPRLRALK